MLGSEWLQLQYHLMYCFVIISFLLNTCLIVLIRLKSPKNLGPYKHLMKFISIFEIVYSICDYLTMPVMHSYGSSFFIMTTLDQSFFDKEQALIMQGVWCGCFGASMAIFGIHFVYRYLAVTGSSYISTFKGLKVLLWMLLPVVYGFVWGTIAYLCCGPKEVLTEYIREDLRESFDLSVDDVAYIGPYFYTESGDFLLDSDVIWTLSAASVIMGSSVLTIFYFGWKCYKSLANINPASGHSPHYKSLQTQFFTALVLQTVIPITLMHLPLLISYSAALLNHGLGKVSNLASITIALYPAIDPLPTIFIVKNYRRGLKDWCSWPKRLFRKIKGTPKVESSIRRVSSVFGDTYHEGIIL